MFGKSKDKKEININDADSLIKYDKPKILLIDLPDGCLDTIKHAGYNVLAGTFGSPYKVKKSDTYEPVIGTPNLPNYNEREIIIIDLTQPQILDRPHGERLVSEGELDVWAKCSKGVIDPRPRFMEEMNERFQRILDFGGLFVIFAQPRLYQKLRLGYVISDNIYGSNFAIQSKPNYDNWSFLSILSDYNLDVYSDDGDEVIVNNEKHPIFNALNKYLYDSIYCSTFEAKSYIENNWITIAKNKFGNAIAGFITFSEINGRILILPQINNKTDTILTLLNEVLPETSPHLFPHIEGLRWVERDEYELESIKILKDNKIESKKRAQAELDEIENKITEEREKNGFLHGMITQTGDELVSSVKKCLEFIGFEKVVDVDTNIDDNTQKQEDLQINDSSPILLLEIKGLTSLPTEDDTNQVYKYVLRRMKGWDRKDVSGISIINHQRHILGLDRDHVNVFTDQQINDARNNDGALITTWDLFLLVKGMIKFGWEPKALKELLYRKGRINRIPPIYYPIGKIEKFYDEICVLSIKITDKSLIIADRIGYILPDGYFEEVVTSLQYNQQDIKEANPGMIVGIKTKLAKEKISIGADIYKIISD